MNNRMPVLIDTDIGDDIDDALAIALALCSPEIEIVGITTVYKNTAMRTALTKNLLHIFGNASIPIFKGIASPIINKVDITEIPCQCEDLTPPTKKTRSIEAVQFILESVRSIPNLQIAAIGPLTNLAAAILLEPETMKTANIVLMGGAYGLAEPEWNIACDPEAAHVVFSSGVNIKAIGLDVTTQCELSDKEYAVITANTTEQSEFLKKLIKNWRDTSGYGVFLHDPLVFVYFIKPELFTFEKKEVAVELRGEITRAATILRQSYFASKETHPNVQVATGVQKEQAMNLFITRVFAI